MRRFRAKVNERDDKERGATVVEYVILIAGALTAVSGAADAAGAGMNRAFGDADSGVNRVVVDTDGETTAADDEAPGGNSNSNNGGGSSNSGGGGSSESPGTGTIGYWKTHPEAWPVAGLTLGGVSYTQQDLLEVFDINANKPATLAEQLIGAKLNALVGNDDWCVAWHIDAADTWLVAHPIGSSGPDVDSAWAEDGNDLKNALDDYNNGLLPCADHRG